MKKEHVEILLEDIKGKFDLVLEGHDVLRQEIREVKQDAQEKFEFLSVLIHGVNKRVDAVDKKIDGINESLNKKIDSVEERLSGKIDSVAADLTAHRADTETHSIRYKVSE